MTSPASSPRFPATTENTRRNMARRVIGVVVWGMLVAGCSKPYDYNSGEGVSRFIPPSEAPEPWSIICQYGPFEVGDLVPEPVKDALMEVYVCEGGWCLYPDSEDVNGYCDELRATN